MTAPHGDRRNGPAAALQALRRLAGRVKRAVRAALEGRLHPVRRRRARNRLDALHDVRRIVFVCLGNVCRSPYAAARFREAALRTGLPTDALSAGLIGPGRAPPDAALRQAALRGLDLANHRSRLASRDVLAGTDLAVVMEAGQARRLPGVASPTLVLGDLDPEPVARRTIPDPWGRDEAVFGEVYDRIDRCIEEMVRILAGPAPRSPAPTLPAGSVRTSGRD